MLKLLVDKRIIILAFMAAGLYYGISVYHISLWYVLLVGVVLGVVFGKSILPLGLSSWIDDGIYDGFESRWKNQGNVPIP